VSTRSVMGTTAAKRRRNRAWPEALKREIVAASLVPGASVSVVARSYDVNANQVFSWRKRYRDAGPAAAPRLIPVVVTPNRNAAADQAAQAAETIEIDIGDYRIRVGSAVDAQALRRVLDVLERR
jgi:transposase-like protein